MNTKNKVMIGAAALLIAVLIIQFPIALGSDATTQGSQFACKLTYGGKGVRADSYRLADLSNTPYSTTKSYCVGGAFKTIGDIMPGTNYPAVKYTTAIRTAICNADGTAGYGGLTQLTGNKACKQKAAPNHVYPAYETTISCSIENNFVKLTDGDGTVVNEDDMEYFPARTACQGNYFYTTNSCATPFIVPNMITSETINCADQGKVCVNKQVNGHTVGTCVTQNEM